MTTLLITDCYQRPYSHTVSEDNIWIKDVREFHPPIQCNMFPPPRGTWNVIDRENESR
jgi:hypothetical protein